MKGAFPHSVLLAVAVSGGVIAWAQKEAAWPGQQGRAAPPTTVGLQRQMARLIVVHEMTKLHQRGLETDEQFRGVLDQLWGELAAEGKPGVSWRAKLIRDSEKRPSDLTAFERQALNEIEKGAPEVFQVSDTQSVQYARPIHARKSCVVICHGPSAPLGAVSELARTLTKSGTFKEGDTMATISLVIEPKGQ
jgi:hypothetical protein